MKEYRKAEIEIIAINNQDIITTSGESIWQDGNETELDLGN